MKRSERNSRPGRESLSKRLGKVARQIKARDGHCCRYCAATAESSGAPLQLDHLDAKSEGGADVASNLVLACRFCNRQKSNMPLVAWCSLRSIDETALRAHAAQPLPAL